MRTLRLVVIVVGGVGLAWGGSEAAARQKPSLLQQLMQRKALPDAALVLRLVDAEAELISQRVTYGVRHPTLRYTVKRVAFLRRAARRAPAGGAATASRVAQGLRARMQTWTVQVALLRRKYGVRHPRLMAAQRRLALFRGLLPRLRARGVKARLVPPPLHNVLVERAAARGRMRYYLTRYGTRHPVVVATRASIRHANKRLRGKAFPPAGAACKKLWQTFSLAIARHRGRLTPAGTTRTVSPEVGSALDSLIAERARLRSVGGCP